MIVHLDDNSVEISDPDASVVERDKTCVTLKFDPGHIPAHQLISRIASKYPVKDLFVENPPIEEVIAKLYREM